MKKLLINFLKYIYLILKIFLGRKRALEIYLRLNNKLIYKYKKGKTLILLPSCIQRQGCACNLFESIQNCKNCDQCIVSEIKKIVDKKVIISFVKGGRKAIETIKLEKPDFIIAIACKEELLQGLLAMSAPTYVIPLNTEGSPCKDTTFDIDKLKKIL